MCLQGLALTIASLTFALLPPDKGPILLVSLRGNSAWGLLESDTRLMGKGRFPGSLIVTGAHPPFLEALVEHGVLVLPAVPILCGPADSRES